MEPIAKFKYNGTAPGNDTSDYVLVSMPNEALMGGAGIRRVGLNLLNTASGTLKAQWAESGQATFRDYWSQQLPASETNAPWEFDFPVDTFHNWRAIWTNNGSLQDTFICGGAMLTDRSPSQGTDFRIERPVDLTLTDVPDDAEYIYLLDTTFGRANVTTTTAVANRAAGFGRGLWRDRTWDIVVECTAQAATLYMDFLTADGTWEQDVKGVATGNCTADTVVPFEYTPEAIDFRLRLLAGATAPTLCNVTIKEKRTARDTY